VLDLGYGSWDFGYCIRDVILETCDDGLWIWDKGFGTFGYDLGFEIRDVQFRVR
jgi:hypothetical protein